MLGQFTSPFSWTSSCIIASRGCKTNTDTENLTWDKHIYKMCNKISKKLGLLKRLKKFIPSNTLIMLFNSLVLPHFDYANVVWGTACGTQIKYVYKLQKRAARILTGSVKQTHYLRN